MAKYQLKTFRDIVDAIMEQLKIQSSDSVSRNRIKRNVNFVYLNEVVPYKRWTWLRNSIDLQHQAYINTGTASVTPGSETVTLSAPLGSSRKGFLFSVEGSNDVYRIRSHVANSAIVQLEVPFAGATSSTAKFRIWADALPLPSDCKETIEVRRDNAVRPLDAQSLQELRRIQSIKPKAEGFPSYYHVTDFRTPTAYQVIPGLPAIASRKSEALTKTLVFASSLGASGNTLILPGDRIEVTGANEKTYNGEVKVASIGTTNVPNDTVTYTGLLPLQESITADTGISVLIEAPESDARYREMLLYPSISNIRVNLHVDYIRTVEPMVDDSDEPKMPTEDRAVLYYGGLAFSWNRERNPEEYSNAMQLFQRKLDLMAGKTEDQPEKPLLTPKYEYLRMKRSTARYRNFTESGVAGGGGSGGGGGVVTGTPNTAAIFDSTGELSPLGTVSVTELGYLDGATGPIQAQIDNLTALTPGSIWIGDNSGQRSEVIMSGDATIDILGILTISPNTIDDVKIQAGVSAAKIGSGNVDNTEFDYLDGVTGPIQTQINTAQSTATSAQTAATAAQSDIDAHELLTSGVHGVTGNVVGTSDIQTLSNKVVNALASNVQVDSTSTGSAVDLGTPTATLIVFTNAGLVSIRGINAPSNSRYVLIKNATGNNITLLNQSAGATAANRIITGTPTDLIVGNDTCVALVYDTNASRWQIFGGAGAGGAYQVSGSRASPNNITAVGGITSTANQRQIIFVQGSGGPVTISASPAISAGTTIGQELLLIGRSDTNTLTVPNQSGLVELNGNFTMGASDMLKLIWDGTCWAEQSRN